MAVQESNLILSGLTTLLLVVGCQEVLQPANTSGNSASVVSVPDASDEFFAQKRLLELKLELPEASANALRENPRAYVKATLIENGDKKYVDIGVKLKGAAGSFRDLDDRPALTLHAGKFDKKQRFHAMEKFHLNNSVQDESLLSESFCGELCREANLPAARVAHARVWINDRDLGIYVFKEGFDGPFLKRHFRDALGNLYDGGFCTDINEELEKDSGKGPDDRSDLKALQAACEVEPAEERVAAIEKVLDVEAFINFMALEQMMGHWDGYTNNKNNYRVYFGSETKKARFLPHGMDQMFQDPDFPTMQYPGTIVGAAVMANPAWREAYRNRVRQLLPNFTGENLVAKVDKLDETLKQYFQAQDDDAVRRHGEVIAELKERLVARAGRLREQVEMQDTFVPSAPQPLAFNDEGVAEIGEWYTHEPAENRLEQSEADGNAQLEIAVGDGGLCLASWRQRVTLPQGKYRFEAKMKTEGVEAIEDEKGRGAGLRVSGANRENGLSGDTDLQVMSFEFEVVDEQSEVVLVAELRAAKGRVVIQAPMRLRKLD